MDALCKCIFIIIETILNIEHEDLTCFKDHIRFPKNLFMSIRNMKNKYQVLNKTVFIHYT